MNLNEPQVNKTPKALYNPLLEDFSVNYATDDNPPITYTIHSLEIETFPTFIANHIIKHLAHKIVTSRGVKTNYEDDFNEAVKEITDINLNI